MAHALICPQCGKTVPTDAPQGLCPACLMQAGLQSDIAEQGTIAPQQAVAEPMTGNVPQSTILLACSCGKRLKVRADQQGKRLKCPACGGRIDVKAAPAVDSIADGQTNAPQSAAQTPPCDDFATLPPQTAARPGEETVAPPVGGYDTEPATAAAGAKPVDIPGYEILGELGRGGMGVVYKARHKKLGRLVALKMILAGGHAGGAELDRFRIEGEAIARLQHPNIVQIHEVGEHDGLPFFSLEFCSGGGLDRKLAGTPLPPREAAALVEKLAHAMQAAHDKGVIHRDLKPANVLLAEDGTPKITDFGLAKKLDEAGKTQDGSVMGTPSYMAPEQAGGKSKELGPACDIYALGAILYELLTGRPPFKAATPLDTVMQVVTDDPVPPSQLQTRMPIDVETICLKCLQKEPANRYATALALAEDLRRYQNGEPILARPVGNVELVVKWVKRRPMVAGLSAAVVLVAFFAFVGIAGGMGWALVEREHALGQEKKARDEKAIAQEALLKAEAATKEMKKQLRRAETLLVQVKFENAFNQPEEKMALSMLSTAHLLREAIPLENPPLRESLGLHLGAWIGQSHRLKGILAPVGGVSAVAFSRDGRTMLTGSNDRTARLWDAATAQPLGPRLQHGGPVTAVALSPDGKTALTGSWDKTARLWETATGKPIGPPLQHQHEVNAVAFSPDNKTVLTGSKDQTARLWDSGTGQPLGPPLHHFDQVVAVAFSPDGKTALTGSDRVAKLWETATGKSIGAQMVHWDLLTAVFTPDGKTVLTGGGSGGVRLWTTATGKSLGTPLLHLGVFAVAVSPDGLTVLTGSVDKTARLWETRTGRALGTLQHQHVVTTVAFSPDGKTVLTGSNDRTARLWDVATGRPLGAPLQHRQEVRAVAFSPDGATALTGSYDGARLWDTATMKPPGPHLRNVYFAAFSPDGTTVLTASFDKTTRLWEAATGKPIGSPLKHQQNVHYITFSPDGTRVLMTGSVEKTAQLWATATGKPVGPPMQHQEAVHAGAFSPNSKIVLTWNEGNTAQLWATATGKPSTPPLQHKAAVVAADFSPDGNTVLTVCQDGTAQLWDSATGKPVVPALQLQASVRAVAFSSDGKTVLTGSYDKTARVWERASGKPIGPPLQHQAAVVAVAFSPNGKTVLTGSSDTTARLWEAGTGKPSAPPLQHQDEVVAVAFGRDGKTVLTGSQDNTARLWEAATGKPLGAPLRHQREVFAVAFSPNGKTVATSSRDESARLWPVPRPIEGDPERILLWTQVITGTELDEFGQVRVLDADAWQQRRQQLDKLGGPPQD